MRTVFRRPLSPRMIFTLRFGTPNASARNAINAALAWPSTGGAAMRIFSASPYTPATSLSFAPGWTWISSLIDPSAFSRRQAPLPRIRSTEELDNLLLQPRHGNDQHELRDHDHDQRREVEHTADRRNHAPHRPQQRKGHRVEHPGERPVGRDPGENRLHEDRDDDDPQGGLDQLDDREHRDRTDDRARNDTRAQRDHRRKPQRLEEPR